jgi:hypothetical protein
MQFLFVIGRSHAGREAVFAGAQLKSEIDRVREIYASGVVRNIWSRSDAPGACLLLEEADYESAKASVATLPLMQAGMLQVESCIGLQPYRGFATIG